MKEKFSIKGMSCSACVVGIEKCIKKLDGVKKVEVSLLAESMVVDYDQTVLDPQTIIGSVNKLGYTASAYGGEKKEASKTDWVLMRFLASLGLLLPLMYFSMGEMWGFSLPDKTTNFLVQLVLTVLILILNYKYFTNGTRAVINKSANMDTLVALSAGGSFLFSLIATVMHFCGIEFSGHLFFESAAMVVTLVTLGKWLEDKSKRKTGKEIDKLSKLVPKTVTKLQDGQERVIQTSEVVVGDLLLFRTGDYIAVDGTVREGLAFVDNAAITGESLPVEVGEGQPIVSGSILKSGYVIVVAEKVGENTLFAKIIESVRTAGASKAPVQKFVDKVSGIFVPVVAAIAVITFVVWFFVSRDVFASFNYAISVLVISCPCALGLATPVAIMATTGKAAALGILFKDAESIQKAQNVNCVLLDKTATITEGKPKVIEAAFLGEENRLKAVAAAIESKSTHPLAICIGNYCGISDLKCDNYEYIAGRGTVAVVDGEKYFLGNDKLVEQAIAVDKDSVQKQYAEKGYTTVYLASADKILAVFAIADTIKHDSLEAILALNAHNIETVMVTGDNSGAASYVAQQAHIGRFVAEVLPNGKVDVVKQFQKDGKYVAMVGDGINDSPAIKSADVGIAVGTGTDIAIDSADIVVVRGSLKGILDAIRLSKKSNNIIKGNLFWAFFYNVIAIPVAAGVFSTLGIILTPSIAALCMCLSSLFVVTNALRVFGFKSSFKKDENCNQIKEGQEKICQIATAETSNSGKENILYENKKSKGEMIMKTIYVKGMSCMHCVKHVENALMKLDGVTKVDVDLATTRVDIFSQNPIDDDKISAAIADAGYEVATK